MCFVYIIVVERRECLHGIQCDLVRRLMDFRFKRHVKATNPNTRRAVYERNIYIYVGTFIYQIVAFECILSGKCLHGCYTNGIIAAAGAALTRNYFFLNNK